MPSQETSTASGPSPGAPASTGAPPGGAATQPVSRTWKGTAARAMSVAPLALALLAQVGVIGHGGGTGGTAGPTSTQAAKCGTGITDYQACHDHYATGCSAAGGYDSYLNALKNELVDPAGQPQHVFHVPDLVELEKQLPADITKVNHEALKTQMSALGEGEVASLNGYLYYAKDGGAESSNCGLKGADNIDFHIGIGGDASIAAKAKAKTPGLSSAERRLAVIVEMTPHWRAKYEPGWNLAQVQKAIGRQVYVVGQLLADNEHDDAKDDCAYTGAGGPGPNCWRGTIWELHPVTRFLVCTAASGSCAASGAGAGWTPLESFDPAKADGAAATKAPSSASPAATAGRR
jgi:hypothetical protein